MTQRSSRLRGLAPRLALAVAGGVLCFLAFTSFGTHIAALVCLVPVWLARRGAGERTALIVGFAFGLTMNLAGYYWVVGTMRAFGGFPVPVAVVLFVLLAAYQGGQLTLFVWLSHRVEARGVAPWLAAPIAIAAAERVYPLLFPSYFGAGLHELPILQQSADLGGPILVSAIAVVVNIGIYRALDRAGSDVKQRRRDVAIAAAVLLVALGYGHLRMREVTAAVAAAPKLRLGLVQASVGIAERAANPRAAHMKHLRLTLELQRDHAPDLIVWPESGFHFALPDGLENVRDLVTGPAVTTPLLFGAGRRDSGGNDYNTVFHIDGSGNVLGSYDKTYLLMFGEYMPFGEIFPSLYRLSPSTSSMSRGTHQRPFQLGEYAITALICYEDLLPGFTRRAVRVGSPHLLVNFTNDAWFGDTLEPWLHLALSKLRAVEHRRFLVRSTNTGVSAIIDPVGRVQLASGVFTREGLVGEVGLIRTETFYGVVGDVVGWLGLALAVWLGFWRRPAVK